MAGGSIGEGDTVRVCNGGPYDGLEGEVVAVEEVEEKTVCVVDHGDGVLVPMDEEDVEGEEVVRTIEQRGGTRYYITLPSGDHGGVYHRTDFNAAFFADEIEDADADAEEDS